MAASKPTPAANAISPFDEETMTIRGHLDPDKHLIGDAIAAASSDEIAATIGSTSSTGFSPYPARADHTHQVDPSMLPSLAQYNPSITNLTLGSGAAIAATYVNIPIQGTVQRLIHVQVSIIFGTGAALSGDVGITLPVSSSFKFMGKGMFIITGGIRYPLVWFSQGAGTSAQVRAPFYRPADASATRTLEASVALNGIVPALTLTSGDNISVVGSYLT